MHNFEALLGDRLTDDMSKEVVVLFIFRKEDHSYTVTAFFRYRDSVKKDEFVGNLNHHSCSVSGFLISAFRTSVSHIFQDCESFLHDVVVLAAIDVDHQSDTTGIVFF